VLDFDVTWQGIQSWESLKNPWTDWGLLDYTIKGIGHTDVKWFGTTGITVTCNTTGRAGASATYVLNLNSPQPGDKVTLWYQNQSFISPAISTSHTTTDQALCGTFISSGCWARSITTAGSSGGNNRPRPIRRTRSARLRSWATGTIRTSSGCAVAAPFLMRARGRSRLLRRTCSIVLPDC
jgi:hypothetical protein